MSDTPPTSSTTPARLAPAPSDPALTSEAIKHLRHDLRTPLNQMIGYCEMIIETVTESGPPEMLDDQQRL